MRELLIRRKLANLLYCELSPRIKEHVWHQVYQATDKGEKLFRWARARRDHNFRLLLVAKVGREFIVFFVCLHFLIVGRDGGLVRTPHAVDGIRLLLLRRFVSQRLALPRPLLLFVLR